MQKIIKAVIFDLDGVIIDSNPEIERFWHHWAAKTNRQLTRNNITEHIHGRKGVETLEALFNDISAETREMIIQEAIDFDSKMDPAPIRGIQSFIQTLCSLHVPLGLVTSSHNKRAELMLKKQSLSSCFEAFVTAEEVTKGKPHPEPYVTIARKLNVQPGYCLVFEDAISGVQSARAAGMTVIGINTEEGMENLLGNGAARVVSNFDELTVHQDTLFVADEPMYTFQAI